MDRQSTARKDEDRAEDGHEKEHVRTHPNLDPGSCISSRIAASRFEGREENGGALGPPSAAAGVAPQAAGGPTALPRIGAPTTPPPIPPSTPPPPRRSPRREHLRLRWPSCRWRKRPSNPLPAMVIPRQRNTGVGDRKMSTAPPIAMARQRMTCHHRTPENELEHFASGSASGRRLANNITAAVREKPAATARPQWNSERSSNSNQRVIRSNHRPIAPYAPIRLSRMMTLRLSGSRPPKTPSQVSANPSSWSAPVTRTVIRIETSAA